MSPASKRLDHTAFRLTLASGRSVHTSVFSIKYLPAEDDTAGVAVVVPKKVVRGAVGRHVLKRRIVAALRAILRDEPLPYRIIVFTKHTAVDRDYRELEAELRVLLRKAGLI